LPKANWHIMNQTQQRKLNKNKPRDSEQEKEPKTRERRGGVTKETF